MTRVELQSSELLRRVAAAWVLAVGLCCFVGIAAAESLPIAAKAAVDPFLRILKNDQGRSVSMDTAVARYQGKNKQGKDVVVDLVAAVHIGERSYYDELNQRFKKYDAVLYELIIPEGQSIPKHYKKSSDNFVSTMQQGMKQILGLEFQLEAVDYHVPNMVHADLTVEAFERSMKVRGESIWTMFFRLILQSLSEQQRKANSGNELLLLLALMQDSSEERAFALRRYLAENFSQIDEIAEKIEGPKGSAIIADRNRRALDVLQEQMGKGKTHIAIFYGAAHLPDMDKHLRNEFKLKREQTDWIPAWTLAPEAVRKVATASGK